MKKFTILLISLISTLMLNAQCVENGNYWNESWVSCTTSSSPNPLRGDTTHWLLYEFQQPQYIDSTYIWNANRAGESGWGAKDVVIDYSLDGSTWFELGQFFFPQAPETSDYSGFLGPEFDGVFLVKILITILSTHDEGACASLAELQFKIDPTACYGTIDACGICNGPGESTWFLDADLDGLGDPNSSIDSCSQPPGYVENMDDLCDNGNLGWAEVAPLFEDNGCNGCHGNNASGGLDLRSFAATAAGGDICGTDLLTGTKLVDIINIAGYDGCGTSISLPSMNTRTGNQLDAQEIAMIQKWIDGGAPEVCTDFCLDSEEEEMVPICESENYTFPDGTTQNNITTDVTYISYLTSTGGCDSIITTNLMVQLNFDIYLQVALCSGDEYIFPDGSTQNNITTPITQMSSLQTIAGCDSTITTEIIVNEIYNSLESIELCEGENYTLPDGTLLINITTDASYISNMQTIAGCDSVIQSDIVVLPIYNQTESVTLCSGSSYTFPDGTVQNNITSGVTYTSTLTTGENCDSTIVTSIAIDPDVLISESFDICEGSSYTFPDGTTQNNITNNQIYVSTINETGVCDTIITTNLIVLQNWNFNEIQQICEGESYTFPDGTTQNNITTNQSYTSLLVSSQGCDSTIITELMVGATYSINLTYSICEGASFTFADGSTQNDITSDLQQTSILTSSQGCDSLLITNLDVNPVYSIDESAQICEGESYTFPDGTTMANIMSDQTYTSELASYLGCDSIITTDLTISPIFTQSEQAEICEGEDYTFPDGTMMTNITSNTSYTSSFQTNAGCDSLIQSDIIVSPNYDQVETVSLCSGSSYTFPDGTVQNNITVGMIYTSALTSSQGCDSTIVSSITVDPEVLITEMFDICEGNSYTYPDGTTESNITTDQTYVSMLAGNGTCDTIITTNLMVQQNWTITEAQQICAGGSYTFPDGSTMTNITTDQTYTSLLVSTEGCDSTVITELEATAGYTIDVAGQVCAGASYTFPDGSVQNNITIDVQQISQLVSIEGCDSLVTTNVAVVAAYMVNESSQLCEGASYTFPDGTTVANILVGQTYTSELISTQGCDSTIVTELMVSQNYDVAVADQICDGGSYTFPDGSVQNNIIADVQQSSMLTTINGCDSLVTTSLEVVVAYMIDESSQICEGESYTFPDGSVQNNITTDVQQTSILTATSGCDSLVTTNLEVVAVYMIDESSQICEGESYTFPDGVVIDNITNNVIYNSTLQSTQGCDSIVVTNLGVYPLYEMNEVVEVCEGEDYTFPDGITQTNVTSDLTYVSSLVSTNGCDSIITTALTVDPVYESSEESTVCEGTDYTFPDGTIQTDIQTNLLYISTLLTSEGCDSLITTELLVTVIDTTVEVQGASLMAASTADTYQWLDCENNFEIIPGAIDQMFNALESGTYAVALTQDGCTDTSYCHTILLVGIGEVDKQAYGLKPNPVKETLYLVGTFLETPTVQVYNALGQLCLVPFNASDLTLNVNHLASGVYYLELQVGDNRHILEFVKQW